MSTAPEPYGWIVRVRTDELNEGVPIIVWYAVGVPDPNAAENVVIAQRGIDGEAIRAAKPITAIEALRLGVGKGAAKVMPQSV